jgi:hypothetical protein
LTELIEDARQVVRRIRKRRSEKKGLHRRDEPTAHARVDCPEWIKHISVPLILLDEGDPSARDVCCAAASQAPLEQKRLADAMGAVADKRLVAYGPNKNGIGRSR